MARPRKFKKEEVVDALLKAHGLKTGAAELLGCSHDAISQYCQRYEECQAVVDHWRKRRKDRAEYKLDEAIERGESWAIMFTLKNANDREYSEKVSVEFSWRDEARKQGYDPDILVKEFARAMVARDLERSQNAGTIPD